MSETVSPRIHIARFRLIKMRTKTSLSSDTFALITLAMMLILMVYIISCTEKNRKTVPQDIGESTIQRKESPSYDMNIAEVGQLYESLKDDSAFGEISIDSFTAIVRSAVSTVSHSLWYSLDLGAKEGYVMEFFTLYIALKTEPRFKDMSIVGFGDFVKRAKGTYSDTYWISLEPSRKQEHLQNTPNDIG